DVGVGGSQRSDLAGPLCHQGVFSGIRGIARGGILCSGGGIRLRRLVELLLYIEISALIAIYIDAVVIGGIGMVGARKYETSRRTVVAHVVGRPVGRPRVIARNAEREFVVEGPGVPDTGIIIG